MVKIASGAFAYDACGFAVGHSWIKQAGLGHPESENLVKFKHNLP